jgi:RIO kinase 1
LHDEAFEHFLDEGLIHSVIRPIKSGKEASVHLCRANPSTTEERLAALKVYHPPDRRAFRDEGLYRDGEFIKPRTVRKAVEKRTRFGREVAAAIWVNREWEMLGELHGAGADVPRPIARTDRAILMSYVGDEDDAAPQLRSYRLERSEADDLFRQVLRNIELFLYRNVIHGDLSPYNVLVWEGRVTVIDLPQAVDPRKNRHARTLLERDVERVVEHFAPHGVRASAHRIAADYWTAWEFADLVPEELRGLV